MLNIFISSLFSSIILIVNGIIFSKLLFNTKVNEINIWESGIYGFITVGFVSVTLNFFFPINKLVGSIFFISSLIIFFIFFYSFKKRRELIFIILFVTFTSFLLVTSANINRPDAGLYHLPYIRILQENKIILGLTNLHFRFGFVSIFQYISSIYNNFFFKNEFLNLPLASLFPFFFLYLINKFISSLNKINASEILSIFFLIIFTLYSFNRFSNYGNDVPASIFFFILIVTILKIEKLNDVSIKEFFVLSILSIFLLTLKASMAIVLLLPLIIFFLNRNKIKILKHKNLIIILSFLLIWFLKNTLISGCLIFPLKETCFSKIFYFNENLTIVASDEPEAWAKGYPTSNKTMNYKEYNSNFNWIGTWSQNHLIRIIEKLLPFLILILLFLSKKILNKSFYKNFSFQIKKDKKTMLIIFFSSYCIVLWFLKFPLYRFGMSFISTFIIFTLVGIFISGQDYLYNKRVYFSIICVGLIFFYLKNINRIIDNYDLVYKNSPWPQIYSFNFEEKNKELNFQKIVDDNNNLKFYYSDGELCMYSKSPCSNLSISNIERKKIKGYSVFYIKKN